MMRAAIAGGATVLMLLAGVAWDADTDDALRETTRLQPPRDQSELAGAEPESLSEPSESSPSAQAPSSPPSLHPSASFAARPRSQIARVSSHGAAAPLAMGQDASGYGFGRDAVDLSD